MKQSDQKTIARILKVNHAGEYGAIRIYRAQIFLSRFLYQRFTSRLKDILLHEQAHCAIFQNLMHTRKVRPCYSMFFWSWGGIVLGLLTGLFGAQGMLICTLAVEETVHRHMDEQLFFLEKRDPEAWQFIQAIQSEELTHIQFAQNNIANYRFFFKPIYKLTELATETVIWLSTNGQSVQLNRAFKNHKSTSDVI